MVKVMNLEKIQYHGQENIAAAHIGHPHTPRNYLKCMPILNIKSLIEGLCMNSLHGGMIDQDVYKDHGKHNQKSDINGKGAKNNKIFWASYFK